MFYSSLAAMCSWRRNRGRGLSFAKSRFNTFSWQECFSGELEYKMRQHRLILPRCTRSPTVTRRRLELAMGTVPQELSARMLRSVGLLVDLENSERAPHHVEGLLQPSGVVPGVECPWGTHPG